MPITTAVILHRSGGAMEELIRHIHSYLPVIRDNIHRDTARFILDNQDNYSIPAHQLAELIECYQKAPQKYPRIHREGMVYTRKSLEQATGEAMINFKANAFGGRIAADGTGGLGMDTYALARNFDEVIYIEPDPKLLKAARNNHRLLGVEKKISYHNTHLEEWLTQFNDQVDLIYVDPSRRNEQDRYYRIEDSEPDISRLVDSLVEISERVVCKFSPLLDVDHIVNSLPNVRQIECLSVAGEVKEVLTEFSRNPGNPEIIATPLDASGNVRQRISRDLIQEDASSSNIDEGDILFEPDPAVIKAGAVRATANWYDLSVIGNPGFYLIGNSKIDQFAGKQYEIWDRGSYQPKKVKKAIRETGVNNIRIHRKNFPFTPARIFKSLKLKMGNEADLLLTRDNEGRLIYFIGQQL